MPVTAGPQVYPRPLRLLHWTTVFLVVVQVGLAALNALVYEPRPLLAEAAVQAHLSLGAIILVLTLLRLLWRSAAAVPPLPQEMGPPARWAARSLHAGLYLLLLLLPISGYVKLAALGFEIRLFGLVGLPPLPLDPGLAGLARNLHTAGAALLAGLVALHVGAAVLHRRLLGSAVLHRMWPSAQATRVRSGGDESGQPGKTGFPAERTGSI